MDQTAVKDDATRPMKKFEFKKSALSAVADELWSKSKKEFFANQHPHKPIVLEKKTLSAVPTKEKETSSENQTQSAFAQSTYIFGRGIAERVITNNEDDLQRARETDVGTKTASELFQDVAKQKSEIGSSDNSKSEPLFASKQIDSQPKSDQAEKPKKDSIFSQAGKDKDAAATENPTTSAPLTTGEEGESVMFQTNCKLHSFDNKRKQWVEKGLSNLRVNRRFDKGVEQHRIVARTTGTQKVVINSKVFSTMLLERVNEKRIKISAVDPEVNAVHIFLITIAFSKADTCLDQLFSTLEYVIGKEKRFDESNRKRKADTISYELAPKVKGAVITADEDQDSDDMPNETESSDTNTSTSLENTSKEATESERDPDGDDYENVSTAQEDNANEASKTGVDDH